MSLVTVTVGIGLFLFQTKPQGYSTAQQSIHYFVVNLLTLSKTNHPHRPCPPRPHPASSAASHQPSAACCKLFKRSFRACSTLSLAALRRCAARIRVIAAWRRASSALAAAILSSSSAFLLAAMRPCLHVELPVCALQLVPGPRAAPLLSITLHRDINFLLFLAFSLSNSARSASMRPISS